MLNKLSWTTEHQMFLLCQILTDIFVWYGNYVKFGDSRVINSYYERYDQSQLSVGATDQIDVANIVPLCLSLEFKFFFVGDLLALTFSNQNISTHYNRYNWQKHYISMDITWTEMWI